MVHSASLTKSDHRCRSHYSGVITNEPLIYGFSLLRLVQKLLNPDVHYIQQKLDEEKSESTSDVAANERRENETRNGLEQVAVVPWRSQKDELAAPDESCNCGAAEMANLDPAVTTATDVLASMVKRRDSLAKPMNILEEFASLNPLPGWIKSSKLLGHIYRLLTIFLSLLAIMVSVDKTISSLLLCMFSRMDIKRQSSLTGQPMMPYEASDITMSWLVLVLINLSSTLILFSTIFNGHLLWNLFNQRLFLVSRKFQYGIMLYLLGFVYLEYVVNISFINNLFGWSFVTDDTSGSTSGQRKSSHNIHDSYSILSGLEIFVTDQDRDNDFYDILLTIFQLARGAIRISPYITINYAILCLREHIREIRNQTLLTDSLKKKQKLRLVVKSSRATSLAVRARTVGQAGGATKAYGQQQTKGAKKSVIFATNTSSATINYNSGSSNLSRDNVSGARAPRRQSQAPAASAGPRPAVTVIDSFALRSMAPSPNGSLYSDQTKDGSLAPEAKQHNNKLLSFAAGPKSFAPDERGSEHADPHATNNNNNSPYCDRIKDFYELESYIINLYIFTGRLNSLMSRQGLAMFFVVHNLVISCSLIVPEAILGGTPMVYFIRVLLIFIAYVPFRNGQCLNGQLEQLSKQIDRIIIHQQFFGRRRDNLVRIRELLHDIRVDCAGMLNFNIESGLKYLVIAFASAFFIEQEDYKLTRRH